MTGSKSLSHQDQCSSSSSTTHLELNDSEPHFLICEMGGPEDEKALCKHPAPPLPSVLTRSLLACKGCLTEPTGLAVQNREELALAVACEVARVSCGPAWLKGPFCPCPTLSRMPQAHRAPLHIPFFPAILAWDDIQ